MKTAWSLVSLLLLTLCLCQCALSHHPKSRISEAEWENRFRKNYEDRHAFDTYKLLYQKGLFPKNKAINLRDPAVGAEIKALVKLFYSTINADETLMLLKRLEDEMNTNLFNYAIITFIFNWKGEVAEKMPIAEKYLNMPEWFNEVPNYFIPKEVIDELNELKKVQEREGMPLNRSEVLLVPENSEWAAYMTEDPVLNNMYWNWHVLFPTWVDPKELSMTDIKHRGQVYYDFHNQLLANYFMKITTYPPLSLCNWQENSTIKPGFKSRLTNFDGQPIASRSPDTPMPDNDLLARLREIENKLEDSRVRVNQSLIYVNDTYFYSLSERPDEVREVLSNLIFNTTESLNPEYFGSYYDTAVNYLASIGSDPDKDGGGPAGYKITALRDPAYYFILHCVILPIKAIQYTISGAYKREDLTVKDLTIDSLGASRLETFYEMFEIDLMGTARPKRYPIDQLRLNHKPFAFQLKLTNSGVRTRQAVVTIALQRTRDKDPWNPIASQHQIMDRFQVDVAPGEQVIERNFNESLVFTDEKVSVLRCGIPKNLALPKGERDGLNLTLLAFLSPYDPWMQEPEDPKVEHPHGLQVSPLCGNTRLNYGRSFDFPLDKPFPRDVNYGSAEVTVYHEVRGFRGGVRM